MMIRETSSNDIPALMEVLDATELFPSDMLAAMVSGFLSGQPCDDLWLTCELSGKAVGFCYARAEPLTDGTWNMLAIAVHPAEQGAGIGAALVGGLEERLRANSERILIADTSGTAAFAQTRAFYRKRGYAEEARLRDFWADGDDKITFWKSLRQ